ncbi:dentin sialophosphoprotein [Drosophila grimshawi]|uniref:GH22045 n=1 Tax=Drosophila grimshawi TaxID=7222 RepID=B4J9M3_DROGR|nr:dentin sialophosphoprotein [Drosophila grimshawi]EDW02530.1 GH22045 [Drosophila grimshawi]
MSGYTDLTKLETSRNCLRRIARHDEQQFSKDSIVNVMEKFVKTVNTMDDTILVPCRLMDRQIGDSTDIIPASGKDTTANQLTKCSGVHRSERSKNVHDFLNASELFNLYTMLNSLKKDLLWTANQDDDLEATEEQSQQQQQQQQQQLSQVETKTESNTSNSSSRSSSNTTTSNGGKGHVRRTSTASMMSTTSVSNMSDSDSDMSNEIDSGLESDGNKSDNAQSTDGSDIVDACQKSSDKATELAKRCKRHLNGLYQCLEQMTEAANYLTARYQSDIGSV